MSRTFLASGLACALAVVAPLAAQDPQQTPPQPTTPSSAAAAPAATVSIDGCLMRELDVPGRRAPDAMRSRTNTDDDYVLVDAKPSQSSTQASSVKTPQPDTPVGTSGSVTASPVMYKVKEIDSAQLVQHKGQRVRIIGTLDRTDRTNNPDTFAGDLVQLRGTAIQKIDGECPAKPNDKH